MKHMSVILASVFALVIARGCDEAVARGSDYCAAGAHAPLYAGEPIERIYWSDADSGIANGVCFRIKDFDAAETGHVGSPGGAKCEQERQSGYESKAKIVQITKGQTLIVSGVYGFDKYSRQIISFNLNNQDLAETAQEMGVYHHWPFFKGRALKAKPNYCN